LPAQSKFFFNLSDNSANLDNQNGGFTVFGSVVGGMNVRDHLANFPTRDEGGVFSEIPLQNYNGTNFPTDTNFANYAGIGTIEVPRHSDRAFYSVTSNTNPAVVTPIVIGNKLTLRFGFSGTSILTVKAVDSEGQMVIQNFTVTVGP